MSGFLRLVQASGNSATSACSFSPASAADPVVSINSMDNTDTSSSFTNYGSCTNIYAPGSAITSTWIGSRFSVNTISGTSMASPHVAGVMALLAQENDDVNSIFNEVDRSSTPGKILRNPSSIPNKLLFKGCSI